MKLSCAGNSAISLAVLGMGMAARAKAALFKAACMGVFGAIVLGRALWNLNSGVVPEPATMGVVGVVALAVNAGVAAMLYRFRSGDANMRSVWICSRNDAFGNVAVMLAALGVFGTGSAWPDLLVAAVMGVLALTGAAAVGSDGRQPGRINDLVMCIECPTGGSVSVNLSEHDLTSIAPRTARHRRAGPGRP